MNVGAENVDSPGHKPGNSEPKISYVIPCYNARRYLAECLKSIVDSETEPFEVIVVDDGSTEAILDIVETFGSTVQYIRQANQGAGAARNTGIRAATGQYIRFVDADDVLLSAEALLTQIAVLDQNPGVGLVYGQSVITDGDGRPLGIRKPRFAKGDYVRDGAEELERLLLANHITTSTTVVRRSLIERIGIFRTDLRAGQDYEYWIRIVREMGIGYVAMPVAAYRMHNAGITAVKTTEQRQQKMDVIDQLFEDPEFAHQYARIRPRIEARRAWKAVSRAYRTEQLSAARKGAFRGLIHTFRFGDWELVCDYSWLLVRAAIPTRVRVPLKDAVRRGRTRHTAGSLIGQ